MSRGFVREDDQEEPVFIPPRAALPPGLENLVTPLGLELLRKERDALEASRKQVRNEDEAVRRRELAEINGKLELLNLRIANARTVPAPDGPPEEVRFGTTVRFRITKGPQAGTEREFTLVGADEASVADGKIAYFAPIAQVLLGRKVGDTAEFRLGSQVQVLEVMGIS